MSTSSGTTEFFDTLARVLLRCAALGFLLLLFWLGFLVLAWDLVYSIHGRMFGLTPHELNVIHYCGMGLVKMVIFCFFVIPWAAIRLVLKSQGSVSK
jgi:hypothetical protein